jgi:hypothetical protein
MEEQNTSETKYEQHLKMIEEECFGYRKILREEVRRVFDRSSEIYFGSDNRSLANAFVYLDHEKYLQDKGYASDCVYGKRDNGLKMPVFGHVASFKIEDFSCPRMFALVETADDPNQGWDTYQSSLREGLLSHLTGDNLLRSDSIDLSGEKPIGGRYLLLSYCLRTEKSDACEDFKNYCLEQNLAGIRELVETTKKFLDISKTSEFRDADKRISRSVYSTAELFAKNDPRVVGMALDGLRTGSNLEIRVKP